MNVFTIPSDQNFLEVLAKSILKETNEGGFRLPDYKILLPNRRSCQNLRDAFLDLSDGKMLLLPQIRPLGDVEEEELYFSESPEIARELALLPPVMSPVRRQFLLVRLIKQLEEHTRLQTRTFDQTLHLARALGLLLDQIIIEELSFEALDEIVPEEFSDHWQVTLDFLDILRSAWPKILEEEGMIEAAERRNRLLHLQASYWQENPPQTPIIAAGSTGTMPATAKLMKVIAGLPQGQVILPGFDLSLDQESWDTLEPSHPQYLFRDLLDKMDLSRGNIHLYQAQVDGFSPRQHLATEIMRPAETVHLWREGDTAQTDNLKDDLRNIALYECETLRQEAVVIALKLRETLENKTKTAALVTPDRALAEQVKSICKRWDIELDDTAGTRLLDTDLGVFLTQPLKFLTDHLRPSLLLGLLKHPLCALGMERGDVLKETLRIDKDLRGPAPADIFKVLEAYPSIDQLQSLLAPVRSVFENEEIKPLSTYLEAHLDLVEALAATPEQDGASRLWVGDNGEAAVRLFQQLQQDGRDLISLTPREYLDLIETFMKAVLVRPKYGMHPRLLIMGQIEARLMKADVMVLSGLNEGTWPALPDADPWMSRPMREDFGLPDSERNIALAAHDFIQAFSTQEIVMTRTLRRDGTATVPARWLQRLDIVLRAYGFDPAIIRHGPLKDWAGMMDEAGVATLSATRPQPCPLVSRRPKSLAVTAIESWMRDPYSLYAKHILGLRCWEDVEQSADAALRGSWLHDVFEWFVRTHPREMPQNATDLMYAYALESPKCPQGHELFLPRLKRILEWFVTQEKNWREIADIHQQALEIEGQTDIDGFELRATADRIDRMKSDQSAAIIDYKTGRTPSNTEILNGLSPQMPLEGLILQQGGFQKAGTEALDSLQFWKVSGGRSPGEVQSVKPPKDQMLEDVSAQALEGLKILIKTFEREDTPYISLPDPTKAPPEEWQNYAHLARVQEWATQDDAEGAG